MTSALPTSGRVSDNDVLNALPDPQLKSSAGGYAWLIQTQINFVMQGTPPVTDVVAGNGSEQSLHAIYPYDQSSQSGHYQAVTNFYNTLWTGRNSVKSQITANQNHRIRTYTNHHAGTATVPNSVSYYYLSVELAAAMSLNAPVMNCIQV